jgi:hypothetical protein
MQMFGVAKRILVPGAHDRDRLFGLGEPLQGCDRQRPPSSPQWRFGGFLFAHTEHSGGYREESSDGPPW